VTRGSCLTLSPDDTRPKAGARQARSTLAPSRATCWMSPQPGGLWRVMEPMMRMQMGKEMSRAQLRIKEMVESN
jgi:hypothetical protein